jgi:hypothetical protein
MLDAVLVIPVGVDAAALLNSMLGSVVASDYILPLKSKAHLGRMEYDERSFEG